MAKNDPRTITIAYQQVNGTVSMSAANFQRLLSHITDRDVEILQSVALQPKPKKKRRAKPKTEKA